MFKPTPDFQEKMSRDPKFRKGLSAQAEEAREHADRFAKEAGAPWMRRGSAPNVVVDDSGEHVRLVNTNFGGHLMEWGSIRNPPHAPLRRGVRAAGLKLEES